MTLSSSTGTSGFSSAPPTPHALSTIGVITATTPKQNPFHKPCMPMLGGPSARYAPMGTPSTQNPMTSLISAAPSLPTPRRHPAPTTRRPSAAWYSATTGSAATAQSCTLFSLVNHQQILSPNTMKMNALTATPTAPRIIARRAAVRAPSLDPAPTFCPTLMLPITPTPSGMTYETSVRHWMMACPAACTVPHRPAMSDMPANAPNSTNICAPIAAPRRSTSHAPRQSSRAARPKGLEASARRTDVIACRSASGFRANHTRSANRIQRLTTVAHAAPCSPCASIANAGKPSTLGTKTPSMKILFKHTLEKFAHAMAQTSAANLFVPARDSRNVWNNRMGRMPHASVWQ
mmetsp:Transcript_7602/g.31648  ORF Transcript_7602/g.31648 Transcript_7602/m.31648 type:complete len:348 (+) Transcript_7602:404-1447(+)